MNRYLLVKAYVGFADRLQCLSHAIQYAEKFQRTICVDWSDSIWSDGQIDFHTYFDLVGVPLIARDQLIAKFDAPLATQIEVGNGIDSTLLPTIHPLAWANQLDRLAHNKFIYKEPYALSLDDEDHQADLLVYSSVGFRTFYTSNLCKLRVKRPFQNQIVHQLRRFKDYPYVVHLRGTDRTPPEKYEEYVEDLCRQMKIVRSDQSVPPTKDSDATDGGQSESVVPSDEPILVVSDCLPLFRVFKRRYPKSILRTPHLESYETNVGTHLQSCNKHAHNLEMLIDFFICAYAPNCYHDSSSLFAKMARFLRQGDYCDILGYDA